MTIEFAQPKKPAKYIAKREYPISIRIQQGDDRVYVSTGKSCRPDGLTQYGAKASELNKYLHAIRDRIKAISDAHPGLAPSEVKHAYLESVHIAEALPYTTLVDNYLQSRKIRFNTIRSRKQVLSDYGDFLKGKQMTDLTATAFINKLPLQPSSKNKYAKIIKGFHKALGLNPRFEMPSYKKEDRVYLTEDHIHKLAALKLSGLEERCRDAWLMMAYSGLRVSDLEQLRPEHFVDDYIDLVQVKTNKRVTPVLSKTAMALFKKYNYRMPPRTNRVAINDQIKSLCKGIVLNPESVTCHTARKTYAMVLVSRGLPPQVVATMIGDNVATLLKSYYSEDHERGRAATRALLQATEAPAGDRFTADKLVGTRKRK